MVSIVCRLGRVGLSWVVFKGFESYSLMQENFGMESSGEDSGLDGNQGCSLQSTEMGPRSFSK